MEIPIYETYVECNKMYESLSESDKKIIDDSMDKFHKELRKRELLHYGIFGTLFNQTVNFNTGAPQTTPSFNRSHILRLGV